MKFMFVMLIFGSFIDHIRSCDNNLYISSKGKICEDIGCEETSTKTFPIQTGQTICFYDEKNSKLSIHIREAYNINYYDQLYDTSDFDIKYDKHGRCGAFCNVQNCFLNKKHEGFIDKIDRIQDYVCRVGPVCDQYCWHNYGCTWVHWWLEPIGNVAKVYKFDTKYWEVILEITYGEINKIVTLNANNPSVNLDSKHYPAIIRLPLSIISHIAQEKFQFKNLIEDGFNFYHVDASELNFPETDKIGDFQMQIGNHKNVTFNMDSVKCIREFCNATCEAPQSKLRRFRRRSKINLPSKIYERRSGQIIIKEHSSEQAAFGIKIGDVKINHLYYKQAKCNIDLHSSYGCIGCNQKPYAIFQANSIVEPGIVPFKSNCSFTKKYLSCSAEPFMLEIDNLDTYCSLHMPTLNKTINLATNIEFIGYLDPAKPQIGTDTPTSILYGIMNNMDFVNSATMAMAGVTIFGVALVSVQKFL